MGDATEEFIETLQTKADKEGDEDDEVIYALAAVMASNRGLEVMLNRMSLVEDARKSKALLSVILKLFGYCIKVKKNREELLRPQLRTIQTCLSCLKLSLASEDTSGLGEVLLDVMEKLLVEAAAVAIDVESYARFASSGVASDDIEVLLSHAVRLKAGGELHTRLMRVLPFLTYADADKMSLVIRHFDDVLDFARFDEAKSEAKLATFVAMCEGIERGGKIGDTMKARMLQIGIVNKCIDYLKSKAPLQSSALKTAADDPKWKEFVTKPALRHVLQMMSGLATAHEPTQMLIAQQCITILHRMEQVSSDEHVGSLAESVLEAMRGCEAAEAMVKAAREQTKSEKKKMAMAMRAKQLQAFGLKANEQGQVKADASLLQKYVGIAEESGLACSICREGYKFQAGKVLAIYTFTAPCSVDEMDSKPSQRGQGASRGRPAFGGYSTVTHFNLVHVECHAAAVRQQRAREEWESASLHNANTRCNGLLPLWGPQVPEAAFAQCLARHNAYLAEATNHRDIGYSSTVQDLKLLLLRFAEDRGFSEISGGGGPQSNINLVPYLMHLALYVLNQTRSAAFEEKNLLAFLDLPREKWLESCYTSQGPLYYTAVASLIVSPDRWRSQFRIKLLQRLLLAAHVKGVHATPPRSLAADREIREFGHYKAHILFFALVDQIYSGLFPAVGGASLNAPEWAGKLSEWIRHNDDVIVKTMAKILSTFQEDLLPAASVDEVIDVCGLLSEIPSPASFFIEILSMVV